MPDYATLVCVLSLPNLSTIPRSKLDCRVSYCVTAASTTSNFTTLCTTEIQCTFWNVLVRQVFLADSNIYIILEWDVFNIWF